jgi:hypothetical protein
MDSPPPASRTWSRGGYGSEVGVGDGVQMGSFTRGLLNANCKCGLEEGGIAPLPRQSSEFVCIGTPLPRWIMMIGRVISTLPRHFQRFLRVLPCPDNSPEGNDSPGMPGDEGGAVRARKRAMGGGDSDVPESD